MDLIEFVRRIGWFYAKNDELVLSSEIQTERA